MNRRGILFGLPALTWAVDAPAGSSRSAGPRRHTPPVGLAGAIADGASHPLSSRYSTIAAARAVYPHATSLDDEIDWCALQGAINAALANGGGAVHVPNTGRRYILNKGLLINPNVITVRGDGSVLDFTRLKGNARAVWFKADDASQYGHEKHVFEGFELVGPGSKAGNVTGLFFHTDTEGLSTRVLVRDCTAHDFNFGARFGNRAYLVGFAHCSFYNCRICVDCPRGLEDAGENISFTQCTLFNSYCCVTNTAAFSLRFFACSFDYCSRIVWDNNGQIDFVGCHVEISPPTEPPFHTGHGSMSFFGGVFLVTDNENTGTRIPELFAFNIPSGTVHMFGLRGWNWRTAGGKLTNGPGRIYWHGGSQITEPPAGIGHP